MCGHNLNITLQKSVLGIMFSICIPGNIPSDFSLRSVIYCLKPAPSVAM